MLERQLEQRLKEAARRLQTVRTFHLLAAGWTIAALSGGLVFLATGPWSERPWAPIAGLAAAAAIVALAALALRRLRPISHLEVAREIERRHPELQACLLTAIEQKPQFANGQFGVLQQAVFRRALKHARRHPWDRSVAQGRLWPARLATVLSLLLLLAAGGAFLLPGDRVNAATDQPPAQSPAGDSTLPVVTVEPGDVELEQGAPLIVLARFDAAASLPAETTLVYEDQQGVHRVVMSKSLGDPVFGGRLAEVAAPLSYRVEYGNHATETFQVSVFEYPRLDRADAEIQFPDYAGREPRRVEDTRSVAAVEGSNVTWSCRLNKPVKTAALESSQQETPLVQDAADPRLWQATLQVRQSATYTLRLRDEDGRENQDPAELRVRALPNRPPQIKVVRPARDLEVSPLEEVTLQAELADDYGVLRYGLTILRPGEQPQELPLGEDAAPGAAHLAEHLLALEALNVEPDQLLSYFFWAEDIDGAGETRQGQSDMFFLEVRPLEEIFRQGDPQDGSQQQQQQQQQGGAQQQAEELVELQKQVINATWKIVRQRPVGEELRSSAEVVASAQGDAIEQASELAGELTDPQSRQHVAAATKAMLEALDLLRSDGDDSQRLGDLRTALQPEQLAYQALLRLRAREHQVVRQQQSQQQSSQQSRSSQSRSQQQLQQLELDNEQNRYETQRQASSLQDPQQREMRQMLNRLRELAQRQEDVNERVKELQSALEEAKSQQEREELERQLKRLREQQRQILRDLDDTANKAEQSQNQNVQQMQQQLEQTREQVRETDEALNQQELSQAAAAGAKAEQQLSDLRDEARKQAAGQFNDQAQRLQQDAEQISDRQQQIAENLEQQQRQQAKSLRDPTKADEDIKEQVRQQREAVENLLENIQETVEAAEEAEPLFAKHLYETFRDAKQDDIDDALKETQRWVDDGFLDEAKPAEAKAREGVENLRQGVERAAQSVLGDPTEALRRAQDELDQLAQDLDRERSEQQGARQPGQQSQSGQQPPRGQQPGQQTQDGQQPQQGQQPGQQSQQGQQPQDGQQPGQQPQDGQQPQQGQQPGQQPQDGQQPQQGQQPGQQPQQGQQPQDGQQPQQGQQPGQQPQQGQQPQDGQQFQQGRQQKGGGGPGGQETLSGWQRMTEDWSGGPITGGGFREWSDGMRDVEELVDDPELRAEAARIRDRVQQMRVETKQQAAPPNWELVEELVSKPLKELRSRVAEEIRRRSGDKELAPLDRDPVPEKFEDRVRRYYERLGAGR